MGRNLNDFGGVIPPAAGSEEQIAKSRQKLIEGKKKRGDVTGVKYNKPTEGGGVVVEETIRETPSVAKGKAVRRVDTIPRGPRGAVPEGGTRAKTKDVSIPVKELHNTYTTAINNLKSIKSLSSSDHEALDAASTHLMNSAVSYHNAVRDGGLHTNTQNNDVTHGHLQDAVKHLSYAHETLVQTGIHGLSHAHSIATPLPHDDVIADLSAKSQTLERRGAGGVAGATKPFQKPIPLGKGHVDAREYTKSDVDDLARHFGRNHPGIQKLYTALGTRRGEGSGLIGISGPKKGEKVPSNKAGVVRNTKVDPRYRASNKGQDVRFSSDANKLGQTPKFGEGGKSGTLKGEVQRPGKRSEGYGGSGVDKAGPSLDTLPVPKGKVRAKGLPSGNPGEGQMLKKMRGEKSDGK